MSLQPKKILVVDDNIINQKVVVKMLQRSNCETDVAFDGKEAVAAVQKNRYALIFMDVQMPNMDGLEATRTIRALEGTTLRTPIVAVTANAMPEDRQRCLDSGMDDYLTKPVMQHQIESMMEKWISNGSTHDGTSAAAEEQLVIDPKRIDQIVDIGDNELLLELLTIYREDIDQYVTDISEALTRGDFQQIYESTHKLKGSSANLGIETMTQNCIMLEQSAKDKDLVKVTEQFSAIRTLIDKVRTHIVGTYF